MPAHLINGKALAEATLDDARTRVRRLTRVPGLGIILVGNDPASVLYVALKERAGKAIGVHVEVVRLPQTMDEATLLVKLDEFNRRVDIDGIIVQLPLPPYLSADTIIGHIRPEKDVDGFHPENIAALVHGTPRIIPGLPAGILRLIDTTGTDLMKKNVVILANSEVFTAPLRALLTARGASVVTRTKAALRRPSATLRDADILITALGAPHAVLPTHVKNGAIIIDVGTTRVNGKLLGDVHPDVAAVASWMTPVPGGVGPMTVAMLLANVVSVAEKNLVR